MLHRQGLGSATVHIVGTVSITVASQRCHSTPPSGQAPGRADDDGGRDGRADAARGRRAPPVGPCRSGGAGARDVRSARPGRLLGVARRVRVRRRVARRTGRQGRRLCGPGARRRDRLLLRGHGHGLRGRRPAGGHERVGRRRQGARAAPRGHGPVRPVDRAHRVPDDAGAQTSWRRRPRRPPSPRASAGSSPARRPRPRRTSRASPRQSSCCACRRTGCRRC